MSTTTLPDLPAVTPTLANCDAEPIHIPGTIQPHGVLLASDHDGSLQAWSANAERLVGVPLASGMSFEAVLTGRDPALLLEVRASLDTARVDAEPSPIAMETMLDGREADFLVHAHAAGSSWRSSRACTRPTNWPRSR